jgi:hypothetical protein
MCSSFLRKRVLTGRQLRTCALLAIIGEQIESQQVFTVSFTASLLFHHSAVDVFHSSINVMYYFAMAIHQIDCGAHNHGTTIMDTQRQLKQITIRIAIKWTCHFGPALTNNICFSSYQRFNKTLRKTRDRLLCNITFPLQLYSPCGPWPLFKFLNPTHSP